MCGFDENDEESDGNDLRPSAHMNLRSKFEWLSSQQQQTPSPIVETVSNTKKLPPPVAPKPRLFRRISSSEVVQSEGPISFDQVHLF